MFVAGFHTCDIDLFPFDRHIVSLEDGLHGLRDLRADTVTYDLMLGFVLVEVHGAEPL